jgi:putative FmdB family regulatory protein
MPTYEYRCSQGHQFEQFQRMSEPPVGECPQCGAPAERLLSAGAGLLFKGSGFYITDYRSDSYRKAAAAEGGGSAGSGSGSGDSGGSEAGGRKDAAPAPSPAPKKTGGDSAGGAASS